MGQTFAQFWRLYRDQAHSVGELASRSDAFRAYLRCVWRDVRTPARQTRSVGYQVDYRSEGYRAYVLGRVDRSNYVEIRPGVWAAPTALGRALADVKPHEVIDIDSTDSFLDAPDIKYTDGKTLVEKLGDKRLGTPSPDAPKLPRVDH